MSYYLQLNWHIGSNENTVQSVQDLNPLSGCLGSYLWRLRPLPADRHQNIVGCGPRRGRGGAAGHRCGPAPHILACWALQVIVAPANHRRLRGGGTTAGVILRESKQVPEKLLSTLRRGDHQVRSGTLLVDLTLTFGLKRAEGVSVFNTQAAGCLVGLARHMCRKDGSGVLTSFPAIHEPHK